MNKLLFLIAFCSISSIIKAQTTIPASGGEASGIGGTISYTIGQVVYIVDTGASGSVSKGIQQPYIIFSSGVKEAKDINLSFSAYPNPAQDLITLKIENYELSSLSIQFYDINGKLLLNRKITESETIISMGHFISATYILKISDKENEIKTFKIIKN